MPSITDVPKVIAPELESIYHLSAGDRVECTPQKVDPVVSRGVVVRSCPYDRECVVVRDDVTGAERRWRRGQVKLVHRPIRVVVGVLKKGHYKQIDCARMVQGDPHVLRFIGNDGEAVYEEGIAEMFNELMEKGYEFTVSPIYNDTPHLITPPKTHE